MERAISYYCCFSSINKSCYRALYGGLQAFCRIDNVMMRIVDTLYSIPTIIYVILIMVAFREIGIGSVV